MVDEPEVGPMWMATVQGAVAKFKEASPEEQEIICLRLEEDYGVEAATKAKDLFKAERAVAEAVEEIKAKARPNPTGLHPVWMTPG